MFTTPTTIAPQVHFVSTRGQRHVTDDDCWYGGTVNEHGDCEAPHCMTAGGDPCPVCDGIRFHYPTCSRIKPRKYFKAAGGMYLEEDPDAPQRFAVWGPTGDGFGYDILGAGATADEALVQARKAVEQWRSARVAQAEARVAVWSVDPREIFTDGAWSATTRDDAFSYCPTFTAEFQDGRFWVVHLDQHERRVSIFYIGFDDEETQEREIEQQNTTRWTFSEVAGAIKNFCTSKAIEQVPLALVAQLFFAKGW